MKGNIRSWKRDAKETLKGKYGIAIFAMIIVNSLSMLGSELGYMLFSGSSVFDLIASNVVAFIVTLIVCIFSAGLSYMYLNMARGKEYSYGNLIYFFKNHPDRIIVASFVLALISLIVSLPGFFIGDMGNTWEEVVEWTYKYTAVTIFALIANMILTLPLQQVYYLMADDLELEGIPALKKSAVLMKGNIGKYLLLEISFIPWFVMVVVLMVIGIFFQMALFLILIGVGIVFWLIPYMKMAQVFFYRDLIGDYEDCREADLHHYNGYMGDMFRNDAESSDGIQNGYLDDTLNNDAESGNGIEGYNHAAEPEIDVKSSSDETENREQNNDYNNYNDDYNAEA